MSEPLAPLWDAKRMGETCKRNAERRSRMKPKPAFDEIVKFAYEATLTEMRDNYETLRLMDETIAYNLRERNTQLEAALAAITPSAQIRDDIEELLGFYLDELSHRPSAQALAERVRLWLEQVREGQP